MMPVVVLFKSEADGPDRFVKVLEGKGFSVRSINCLDFQFKNLDLLKEKLRQSDDYEGIVFTSQRAVQGVHSAIEENPEVMTNWKEKKNFCVGEATSESIRKLLKVTSTGKETGNAQSLAALMIDQYKGQPRPKPFLFPSGNLKQDILEKSLAEQQIELEALEIYETVPHENLEESVRELKTIEVDFFVFFSPSGIKFSHELLRKHEIDLTSIKIVAIGPSTKKALDEKNLNCYRMCAKPTPESLLEALLS